MEQELLQDLQVRSRELVAENVALASRNKELEQEVVDLVCELDPIYCPECGSCGETMCCDPTNCKTVQGLYCDHNLKDYDTVCCEAYVYQKLCNYYKQHGANAIGLHISTVEEMLKSIDYELDRDARKEKIHRVEEYVNKL